MGEDNVLAMLKGGGSTTGNEVVLSHGGRSFSHMHAERWGWMGGG